MGRRHAPATGGNHAQGVPDAGAPPKVLRYPVSEIFPAIQGEGMLLGRPTVFVRLGGCDYRCSWCDSLYAVLPQYREGWSKQTAVEIVTRVNAVAWPNRHVTLSGGNPAIHPCNELVKALHAASYRVAVETQGTVLPAWLQDVDDLTISPKPPSAGNVTGYDDDAPLAHLIRSYPAGASGRAMCLKVVIFTDEDYRYAGRVHQAFPAVPFYLQVGTEVGVSRRDDLLDRLAALQAKAAADPLLADAICLPQLHVLIHGHARGI